MFNTLGASLAWSVLGWFSIEGAYVYSFLGLSFLSWLELSIAELCSLDMLATLCKTASVGSLVSLCVLRLAVPSFQECVWPVWFVFGRFEIRKRKGSSGGGIDKSRGGREEKCGVFRLERGKMRDRIEGLA